MFDYPVNVCDVTYAFGSDFMEQRYRLTWSNCKITERFTSKSATSFIMCALLYMHSSDDCNSFAWKRGQCGQLNKCPRCCNHQTGVDSWKVYFQKVSWYGFVVQTINIFTWQQKKFKQEAQRATYRAPAYNVPPFGGICRGGHFWLLIGPKNTNLVEDIEILLPATFRWIPFSGLSGEVENVSANQRPGQP